jgi:hypothetical protein
MSQYAEHLGATGAKRRADGAKYGNMMRSILITARAKPGAKGLAKGTGAMNARTREDAAAKRAAID